eukprot:9477005-Pyramimonas_sp.AAC.1
MYNQIVRHHFGPELCTSTTCTRECPARRWPRRRRRPAPPALPPPPPPRPLPRRRPLQRRAHPRPRHPSGAWRSTAACGTDLQRQAAQYVGGSRASKRTPPR